MAKESKFTPIQSEIDPNKSKGPCITGKFIRRKISDALHRYEAAFVTATQIGSRGLCGAIETYWLTQGIMPHSVVEIPLKVASLGAWAFTKYFQYLGFFHLYHQFVPESKTAELYIGVRERLRRVKENPIEEGLLTVKDTIKMGVGMGRDAITSIEKGYGVGESTYYLAPNHSVLIIRKLRDF